LKFHLSVSGVFDREGEYVGNILQWDNVTAIRTNAGILQAIDRAQAVIEFLPNGQVVKANENFLKTLGYDASEVKGKHHRIFCHPSFAQSPENASQELVVSELATGLRSLSDGNLMAAINVPFDQEYEGLRGDFNSALDKLTATMQKIMSTAANIQNGAVEMSQASDDLSKRTENQAAASRVLGEQ